MSSKGAAAGLQEKPIGNDKAAPRRSRAFIFLAIALAAIVVLAVALGVGLGVGLKHSKKSQTVSTPSPASVNSSDDSGPSLSSQEIQDWRRSTLDYNLDLENWDFDAAPQTRSYNLTLTEIALAPDGKALSKTCWGQLVVIAPF